MRVTRDQLLNYCTALAAASALGLAAARLHAYATPNGQRPSTNKRVSGWAHYQKTGHRIGSRTARVTIVEFADFQCPYCQAAESTLRAILKAHPNDVALLYRHYPLPMHRFARDAARASECASVVGKFTEFHDTLFAQHDSIGTTPWTRFASEVGIVDTAAFAHCISAGTADAQIRADEAAARDLGVTGTPTFLVNDRLVVGFSSPDSLARYVTAALAGKGP